MTLERSRHAVGTVQGTLMARPGGRLVCVTGGVPAYLAVPERVKDLSAELRLLRWEQRAGWLAIAPLRRLPCRGVACRSRRAR